MADFGSRSEGYEDFRLVLLGCLPGDLRNLLIENGFFVKVSDPLADEYAFSLVSRFIQPKFDATSLLFSERRITRIQGYPPVNRQKVSLRRITVFCLLLAVVLTVGLPAISRQLNIARAGGFPLGFLVAAQSVPVLGAALLLAYASRARTLGRRHREGVDNGSR